MLQVMTSAKATVPHPKTHKQLAEYEEKQLAMMKVLIEGVAATLRCVFLNRFVIVPVFWGMI